MADRDEDTASLKALQARMKQQLREALKNVSRLEGSCDRKDLDAWMNQEIDRYGGRRVELDDE